MRNTRPRSPDRGLAVAATVRGLDHQAAEGAHGDVADADALLAAVADRAHRLPHGDILIGNALDAGEVAGRHRRAVLPVEIVRRADVVEVAIDVLAPFEDVEL